MDAPTREGVLAALRGACSPQRGEREAAEQYLLTTHTSSPGLFELLFDLAAEPGEQQLQVAHLLCRLVKAAGSLAPEVAAVFARRGMAAAAGASSKPLCKRLVEAFKLYAGHAAFKAHNNPQQLAALYRQFFDYVAAESDLSRLFGLLQVYLKLTRTLECNFDAAQKLQLHGQSFPLFERIAASLPALGSPALQSSFFKLLARIFHASYRFELDAYLTAEEKTALWMGLFAHVLKFPEQLREACGAVVAALVPFFRKAAVACAETGKPGRRDDDAAYLLRWQRLYAAPFFAQLLALLPGVCPGDAKAEKLLCSVKECLYHLLRVAESRAAHAPALLACADRLLQLTRLQPRDLDDYAQNPHEFFAANYFNSSHTPVRASAAEILGALLQKEAAPGLLAWVRARLAATATPDAEAALDREALYFALERAAGALCAVDAEGGLRQQLLSGFLLPDMHAAPGFVRMQATSLAAGCLKGLLPASEVLEVLTQTCCQNMKGAEYPVKAFAIILMGKLMAFPAVCERVRPQAPQLFEVMLEVIRQHEHESLLGHLGEMMQHFPKEIAPFAVRLVDQLIAIAKRVQEAVAASDGEDLEKELSCFSVFSALSRAVDLVGTPEAHAEVAVKLDAFCAFMLSFQSPELDEEVFALVGQLVGAAPGPGVHPPLWRYFELFAYSVVRQPPLDRRKAANALLCLVDANLEAYIEFAGSALEGLLAFGAKDPTALFQRRDESGRDYFELALAFFREVAASHGDLFDETQLVKNLLCAASLLVPLRDCAPRERLVELAQLCLRLAADFKAEEPELQKNMFLYVVGCLFIASPALAAEQTAQFGLGAGLLRRWLDAHNYAFTPEIRKASFLGLCALLHHRQELPGLLGQPDCAELALFLTAQLVFLDLHRSLDAEDESLEDSRSCSEDSEEGPDAEAAARPETLTPGQVELFLQQLQDRFVPDVESCECWSESFKHPLAGFDHVAVYKSCVAGLAQEDAALDERLRKRLNPPLLEYVQKVLGG